MPLQRRCGGDDVSGPYRKTWKERFLGEVRRRGRTASSGNATSIDRQRRPKQAGLPRPQGSHPWTALRRGREAKAPRGEPDAHKYHHAPGTRTEAGSSTKAARGYLRGNEEYMFDARDFSVKAAGNFYEKYVSQGRWSRCLACMREANMDRSRRAGAQQASDTMTEGQPCESGPQEAPRCKRCIERDDVWKQCLTPNGHECLLAKSV